MTRIQSGVLATLLVAGLVACASTPPSVRRITTHGEASGVPLPRPSAASGPCASVTTTTPIGQVPAACAALWAPYGVTKVPPANLTDSTPVPPTVVNEMQGAVSDAQARAWALAGNRSSVWDRWAEANGQAKLLTHLGSLSLYAPVELEALAEGDTIDEPACAIFPTTYAVVRNDQTTQRFFQGLGEAPSGAYALVATFPGPCTVIAHTQIGTTRVLASYSSSGTTFFVGEPRPDPQLGLLWFVDGAGNCADAGAPAVWCVKP